MVHIVELELVILDTSCTLPNHTPIIPPTPEQFASQEIIVNILCNAREKVLLVIVFPVITVADCVPWPYKTFIHFHSDSLKSFYESNFMLYDAEKVFVVNNWFCFRPDLIVELHC